MSSRDLTLSCIKTAGARTPAGLVSLLALLLVVVFSYSTRADATPDTDFARAKENFRSGQFPEVINLISGLLYPPPAKLKTENDLAEAHLLLGVAYYQTGNQTAAADQFEQALLLDFTLSIEPPLFSSEASDFFAREKAQFEKERGTEEELARKAAEAARLRLILDNMLISERRLFYANFIPFGVGQFQNGHRGKGILFLTSEIAFVGASAGLFTYQLLRYPANKVPADEVDQARTIQVLQVSSGVIGIGLMIAGVLDAWYHYKPVVRRKPSKELLKEYEDLLEQIPGRKQRDPRSFRLLPTVLPDGVGAAVFMEF